MRNSPSLLEKYWKYLVFVFLFVAFYIYKKIKVAPINVAEKASQISGNNPHLEHIARDLAHHLGTAYSWWHFKNWTENDETVFNIVRPLTRETLNAVGTLYFRVYAKGRDLKTDLAKLLDSKYYERLTNL